MKRLLIALLPCIHATLAPAATVFVEAESFARRGGWQLDQQSIATIGSPYLLAHGLGTPVDDATTTVSVPEAGQYRIFVRTKDWVARFNAPGAPGKFRVSINGKPLPETFGAKGVDWSWHDGGTVTLDKGDATLALHDLTGFEGRCDAIVLSSDPDFVPPDDVAAIRAFRRKALGLPDEPTPRGEFDLVVVGGGVAGCSAAISAARLGLDVALIQDRHVLGGNSSSEVRVWIQGRIHQEPYPVLGEIVEEIDTHPKASPGLEEIYGDDVKLRVVRAEKNLSLFLGEHVDRVETDSGRIRAVVSTNVATGRESRYAGRWFVDATGDGTVGVLAGADYEVTEKGHMGASNMWLPVDTGKPAPFPRCPWALDLTDKPFPTELKRLGVWFWESGFDLDTIRDAEAIRDHNLRAMYGAWDCLKNVKKLYPNHRLLWAAYVSGRRESRRLLGDVVLTKEDVLSGRAFPDGCVTSTWSIDLHLPDPRYEAASPGNAFISEAQYTRFEKPFPIPYRCFYSRNVPNLMMAGRDISVTHEALGTTRVMGTNGMMGEALGRAASLCKKHNADPRDVYEKYLDEFKELLKRSTKKVQ
ncbi:MAG: FAD-dependent oxidoreductase [Planctomycetia bacterium]|nr:FAD-dependent oxidoreductase [Planctomycetia bacterium]